jgi:hypothetical protein
MLLQSSVLLNLSNIVTEIMGPRYYPAFEQHGFYEWKAKVAGQHIAVKVKAIFNITACSAPLKTSCAGDAGTI